VPTFSDFIHEVAAEPPPGDMPPGTTVRLVLTERTADQGPVRLRKVTLDLQGLNHHGLIWLSQEISIQWVNGPLGPRSQGFIILKQECQQGLWPHQDVPRSAVALWQYDGYHERATG
jgi:hypothetical protein